MNQQKYAVVGLGEVLWDLLPSGAQLGGAPANFSCHASQLGADAMLVSCVGQDALGDQAIVELEHRQADCSGVARNSHPTGTVEVTLDALGSPSYRIVPNVAWDYLAWTDAIAQIASVTDAVCFGTLGQRNEVSRQTFGRFLAAMPSKSLRILDINLRPPFYDSDIILCSLELANVLKVNDEELPIVASFCGLSGTELEMMLQLAARFNLHSVALTCGERGATLLRDDEFYHRSAEPTEVLDTIGAGDSYTAALALGLLAEDDLAAINERACKVAAFVCSQTGATPVLPPELGLF